MDAVAAPKRSDVREQILRTALHLFTTQGYFNTSVHDIQRAAQVSIGSIYNHFGGKEGIAKALYADLVERMYAFVEGVTEDQSDTYSQCKALVQGLFEMTEADAETVDFMLNARHREFLRDEPPICSSKPFVKMRDIIQQGMDSGDVRRMDLMVAASCAYGPALRMISLRLDGLIRQPLPTLTDEVWESAWQSICSNHR